MSHARRVPVIFLAAALVALCLVGQVTSVAPAGAAQAPTTAKASAPSEQTAGPAPETRRAATLTLDAPLAAPVVEPAVPPPSTRDGWSELMTETFEGIWPPVGGLWTAFDNNGLADGEYFWDDDDYRYHSGYWSAWAANGGQSGLDPYYYYYPPNVHSWMVYGPFDLSGASQANLDFWYWNDSAADDGFFWGSSEDGTNFDGTEVSGNSGSWQQVTLNLSARLGDPSVWVAFVFNSDGTTDGLDGPFVDDITLNAYSGATTPPGAFGKTAPANGATGQPLNPSLSWGAATGAASYEYCYDTSNDNACSTWTSTGTTTSASLAGLTASTTYYWQVRAINGIGTTYADGASTTYWNFTTTGGPVTRDWTYMVYLDGDNNLEAAAVDDFLEMSSVGSTSQVAVVTQMDRITGYDTSYDNWTDTRRFYITSGMTPAAVNGTSIGEANMGAEATLVAFVQWAMASYPADHYALVLWDHGSGWRSRALDDPVTQGIAYDDTSGGDGIDMLELRSALSNLTSAGAHPFDLLGLDACLMALIEVDDQIRPYAGVRVTSQETEPGDGWPHNSVLTSLTGNPAMTAEALGTAVVDQYYASYGNNLTQSAADLGADYAALNTAVDGFAAALLANGAANAAGIQAARTAVQEFDFDYYTDLYDFAGRVQANVANAAIDNAAAAVMAALGPATIHEHHGTTWPGAHGISIYFPKTLGEYDTRYDGSSGFLRFTVDTQWDEWLRAYYAYGTGPGTLGKSAPTDGATGVALSPTLSWGTVAGALWYGYCYDTTDNDACDPISWQDAGTATSAVLSGLSPNTTYYWQVFASTGSGPVYGDGDAWWSFTTGAPVLQEETFRSAGANDGLVIEQDETSGKGGTVDAASTVAAVGDNILDYQYRSILHFETGSLPDNAVIVGITLKIKKQKVFGANPFDTHGYLTVDIKTGTYHDNPVLEKLDFHAVGSRGNVGRFIKTPADGWYRAPLRLPSYTLVNLAGPTQFRLRFATDDDDDLVADYLSFYTGNATQADRPQLIITYYVP